MSSGATTERGSLTLWAAVMIVAFFAIVGLVVDGGGRIRATQEADAVAREAARAAGQALDVAELIQGRTAQVNPARAKAAALEYLKAAGVAGTVTVDGATVTVRTTVVYRPVFLSAIGPMEVHGVAVTRSVRALDGKER